MHACIAEDHKNFHRLVGLLVRNFQNDRVLLERYDIRYPFHYILDAVCNKMYFFFSQHRTNYILLMEYTDRKCVFTNFTFSYTHFFLFRRGALIVRRLCVLLDAERVYRQFSLNLEQEQDLDFASVMVQVFFIIFNFVSIAELNNCPVFEI